MAEVVLIYYYLFCPPRPRATALKYDGLFFDNEVFNPPGLGRTVGSFFQIERSVAQFIDCPCWTSGVKREFYYQWEARPDIINLEDREFYEIKPDNDAGLSDGRTDLQYYHCIFECIFEHRARLRLNGNRNNLPLRLGTNFTPPRQVIIVLRTARSPALFIQYRHAQPGLIVYKYCVDAEGTLAQAVDAVKFVNELYEKWKEKIRQGLGPPGLGGLAPVPVGGGRQVAPARRALEALPAPAPQPVIDVYDEVAKRLFTERELQVIMIALLLLPLVGIAIGVAWEPILAFVATLAARGAALGRLFARAAPLAADIALFSGVANAKETEAASAAQLARSAATPEARAEAATRAADAAREAVAAHAGAVAGQRRLAETERQITAARGRLEAAAQQYKTAVRAAAKQRPDLVTAIPSVDKLITVPPWNARRQPAMMKAAEAARLSAARSAASASKAARSAGGRPSGAPPVCGQALGDFGRIYESWKNHPRRAELIIAAPPSRALASGATQLRLRNLSDKFTARIAISPPSCRTVDIPPCETRIVSLVPDAPHQIAGIYKDDPRPIPGYGEQSFRRGWTHDLLLRPVCTTPTDPRCSVCEPKGAAPRPRRVSVAR